MMTPWIAYLCPLKLPDHPTPSGDRALARALRDVLADNPFGAEVRLASGLRTRDGDGDPQVQARLVREAGHELAALERGPAPIAVFTYHCYYKAPDLIGPALARHFRVPYAIAEASRAPKRCDGPWADFARRAEAGIDAADLLFYMTDRDRPALEADRYGGQGLERLRPFVGEPAPGLPRRRNVTVPIRLLAVAMMRSDKVPSYRRLAEALDYLTAVDWTLGIVGDGKARREVEAAFARFGDRVTFHGETEQRAISAHYEQADLLAWPGLGEAFGLVYLEAQAHGVPCLAENRPGVRDVVRAGGILAPADDPAAYAALLADLARNEDRRHALARAGVDQVRADHVASVARHTIWTAFGPLIERVVA